MRGLFLLLLFIVSIQLTAQENLDEGLVLFYPFDMGFLTDQSGNGYDGVPVGVIPLTSDSSLVLINDFGEVYVGIPHESLLGLTDFTVSTQVRYYSLHYEGTTKNGANGIISGASENSSYANDLLITYRIWDESFVIVLDNVNYYFTEVTLAEEEWYCLSVVRESGVLRLFLDGQKHPSEFLTPDVPINISPNGLLIGQEQDCVAGCFDTAQSLDGEIDNLRFYERALTEEDHLDYCACPEKPVGAPCGVIISTTTKNLEREVFVFPNPAQGNITISSLQLEIERVDIVDPSGKTIFSQLSVSNTSPLELDISNLTLGVYFLKIITETGIVNRTVLIQP